ncbi:hypothetical protein [Pinisolibacter sp.]|uniref:hypothetical protein n=1 Tax=Pinisolibacter sp. TaxID=2172024 RepID=UPI002FDD9D1A
MVAYSFNPRFEAPILSGAKSGTIRAIGRRRHARPGETLQLYVGQRTQHCRLLGKAFCSSVDPIRITVIHWLGQPSLRTVYFGRQGEIFSHSIGGRIALDDFARGDGFTDSAEMARFWWTTHRELIVDSEILFDGVWVRWAPLGGRHAVD